MVPIHCRNPDCGEDQVGMIIKSGPRGQAPLGGVFFSGGKGASPDARGIANWAMMKPRLLGAIICTSKLFLRVFCLDIRPGRLSFAQHRVHRQSRQKLDCDLPGKPHSIPPPERSTFFEKTEQFLLSQPAALTRAPPRSIHL